MGLILVMIMRHAPQTRSLAQLVLLMGLFGFGAALGVHLAIGYTDFLHLLPAYAGLLMFVAGEALFSLDLIRGRSFNATGLASR